MEYNKLIAAFVSVIATRIILKWTGVDVSTLGVDLEWQMLWALVVDLVAASVTGFCVWLVPNVKKRWRDLWA
jgi:hypothetical protein